MTDKNKRGPGRPVEHPMPPRVNDAPENVARAVLNTPPKKRDEWRYMMREQLGR